jgi:hypothetical protein
MRPKMSFVRPGGGLAPQHGPPTRSERVDAEGPDLVDLGLDRSGVYGPLVHG